MLRKCFAVFAVAGLLMLVGQLSAEEKNATAHEGKVFAFFPTISGADRPFYEFPGISIKPVIESPR